MTADRIDKIDKSNDMVKLLGFESNERAMGNKNATALETAGANNKLGYAKLGEEARWHDMEEAEKAKSKTKLQMNEDKKVEDEITTLRTAIAEMDPLIAAELLL